MFFLLPSHFEYGIARKWDENGMEVERKWKGASNFQNGQQKDRNAK